MKYSIIYTYGLLLLSSCNQPKKEIAIQTSTKKTSTIQITHPTDSVLLLNHLDSLPKINFPFISECYNRSFTSIDLSDLKHKKLFDIQYKRIPTIVGGGGLDNNDEDTTFNLADKNYKAEWNLIAKTPKFLVVEVHWGGSKLVTMTYDLKVIDAINTGIADPAGNNHWSANRHSIINKNLTILLQHEYNVQVDEKYNYETETTEEKWRIDSNGRIKPK